MKKLDKYIQKSNFVKVYIGDEEGGAIKHFEGFVFSYSDDFVFMSDLSDFNYDGFVVLRKADIVEIRCTDSEKYFENILRKENILRQVRLQKREYPFRLASMEKMFKNLRDMKIPVIVENLYDEEEEFLIGPIKKVESDTVYLKYFNTIGEFDKELLGVDFDKITFFSFDSPYANLFYKYADESKIIEIELDDELEVQDKELKPQKVKEKSDSKKKDKKDEKKKSKKGKVVETTKKKKSKKKDDSEDKKKSKKAKKKKSKDNEKSKKKKKSKSSKKDKKDKKSKKSNKKNSKKSKKSKKK